MYEKLKLPEFLNEEPYTWMKSVKDPYTLSETDRYRYERLLRNYRDWICTLEYQWREGYKNGLAESVKRNSWRIAKIMKKEDYSLEEIIQVTRLTREELEELETTKDVYMNEDE